MEDDLLAQPSAMRQRKAADGYLLFRGLLPSETVGEVYNTLLNICRAHDWVDAAVNAKGQARVEMRLPFGGALEASSPRDAQPLVLLLRRLARREASGDMDGFLFWVKRY